MPDPIEYLRSAMHAAQTPLVPKRFADQIGDAIDSPSLERPVWQAQLEGFGAGAVEGLRQQLNPLNLALSAIPGYRAARGVMSGAKGATTAARAMGPTMEVIDAAPQAKQVMPAMGDVDALIGDLTRNLARVRPRRAPPAPRPRLPEFTAAGDEAIYNTTRAMPRAATPYGDGFYRDMMHKLGGRGPM